MKVPLAEHFHSIQGEGSFVGTPMHFIRLPGCSVGRPQEDGVTLPTGRKAWLCHNHAGKAFWCDTDFGKYDDSTVDELLNDTHEEHICITGGEPLLHQEIIDEFITQCEVREISVHIETSGTIMFDYEHHRHVWVTCSPKQGFIWQAVMRANELKFLVDGPTAIPTGFLRFRGPIYLSPVNNVDKGNMSRLVEDVDNLDRCMEMLKDHPNWRLSVQLHKYLGMR